MPWSAQALLSPNVTLTSPTPSEVITGGQPTFSGKWDKSVVGAPQVSVQVYQGQSATGTPVETVNATTANDGTYSAPANPPLANGTYTAEAEQQATSPLSPGFSQPVTFTVRNPPVVGLDSPGASPLLTATPTLSGTAETQADPVQVTVFAATGASVRTVSAPVGPDGGYSAQITPGLPDGAYTVQASQTDSGLTGTSSSQAFRIKVNPPAVTLEQPAPGSRVSAAGVVFSGAAGTELGDSTQVTVVLYRGGSAAGSPLGTQGTAASGDTWSLRWPSRLPLGHYTVRVQQRDDAGHTTVTQPLPFQVVTPPHPIGPSVRVTRSGAVSVTVGCTASAGVCSGDVIVLTLRNFQPIAGGPRGRIRVLFAYVSIPAGTATTVRGALSAPVARALRRAAPLRVRVSVTALPEADVSAVRLLLADNR
jgi:hypothetical protein